jgi:hypothetical protein
VIEWVPFMLRILYIPGSYLSPALLTGIFRCCSVSFSTNQLTNSVVKSQEPPNILQNTKIHYRVHKMSPRVPIISKVNSIHIFRSCFFKIYFNIILLTMHRSSNLSPFKGFSSKFCMHPSSVPCLVHNSPILSFLIW